MKKLYFVRHGESIVNASRVWGARAEAPLTALGKRQAKKAGKSIKNDKLSIDVVVSSPTKRARQTAEIIVGEMSYLPAGILFNKLLMERAVGILEGTTFDDFFKTKEYKDLDKVKGAETIEQLQERAQKALAYLSTLPYENVLVVSHSAFGRALHRVIDGQSFTLEYEVHDSLPHAELLEWL